MKTPVTSTELRNYLTYAWWKYVILVVLAIFGCSLIYAMTEPRTPEELKITLGIYAYGMNTNIDAYMENVRAEKMPEMEEISSFYMTPDTVNGAMIVTTRIAAREGDIYALPREHFTPCAEQGGFMALEEVLPELVKDLEDAGVSLSRGWCTLEETGEKHLLGIPCKDLPGLSSTLMCNTDDLYLSVFYKTGNDENVLIFFEQFVRDMLKAPVTAAIEEA